MEVIIVAIIFTLLYILVRLIQGIILLLKALYYRLLRDENKLNKGYIKHVIRPSKDYKEFEKNFDNNYNKFINPK